MQQRISISVVICTMDRQNEVLLCIQSILRQTKKPSQIVVIDSSEDRNLETVLKEILHNENIELTYCNKKLNLTQARNASIELCHEQIITFLDDDTVLEKNYLLEILKVFQNYENVGGVSGNIINGYQSVLRDIFNKMFFLFRYSDGMHRLSGIQTFVSKKVNTVIPVQSLSGANMSISKDVLKLIRFDEDSPYCDDDDISWRISRRYPVFYTPFALIEHNPSDIGGGLGDRSERWEKEIIGLRNHFVKNMPNTFKYRTAFKIAMFGLILSELINLFLLRKGSFEHLRCVLNAIKKLELP